MGVNIVNAIHLARQRGIQVNRTRVEGAQGASDLLEVRGTTAATSVTVAGTILGENHPRLVRIDDFSINVEPRGVFLVLRNRDVPGVIGRVGTLLGNAGINIAEYHQARLRAGGEALAAVTVDAPLPPTVIASLGAMAEVRSVAQVAFG
jgi:D-3-phosphoglycerate dehydrogenase